MKNGIRLVLICGVAFALGHAAVLFATPYVMMDRFLDRAAARNGVNVMAFRDRPTAKNNRVVRQGPDILYSSCVFDLSNGPVRMHAVLPDTYGSLSLFADNTDNFYTVNDRETREGLVDLVVYPAGATPPEAPPGASLVASPSDRGNMIIRMVVRRDDDEQRLDALRRQAVCEAL
jgi:uncharacterized membrane protein